MLMQQRMAPQQSFQWNMAFSMPTRGFMAGHESLCKHPQHDSRTGLNPGAAFSSMFSPCSVLQSSCQLWKMSIQSPALARDLDTASSMVKKCICPKKTPSISPYMDEDENWQEGNTKLGRNCSMTSLFRLCRPELCGVLDCTCCFNPPASPDTLLS